MSQTTDMAPVPVKALPAAMPIPAPLNRRRFMIGTALGLPAWHHACGQAASELDVPFVTTPDNVVLAMLDMAQTSATDRVMDLGSGDGRIPITAALRYGCPAAGVEIDPRLVAQSQANAERAGVADRVRFSVQDLFATDLTGYSVITMYLLPEVNLKLRPLLLALKPGTRLVSHDWDMGEWLPDLQTIVPAPNKPVGRLKQAKLMMWTVPRSLGRQVTGTIKLHRPPKPSSIGSNFLAAPSQELGFRAELEQRYQNIDTGRLATSDGTSWSITKGRVEGETVSLEVRSTNGREVLFLVGNMQGNMLSFNGLRRDTGA